MGFERKNRKDMICVFPVGPFKFVPLVTNYLFLTCRLDITILRRHRPGRNADLDNRLLTLFDSLRKPHAQSELPPNAIPEAHEEPFCCLLEDDSLITDYAIH